MTRASNPEADKIIDQEFPVLDHGHVILVDYCGSDDRVAESARVSYSGGTKQIRDNSGLINYLFKNSHMSPFEMCNMTFRIKLPIFVLRQYDRYRVVRKSELSGRFSVLDKEFYIPNISRLCKQDLKNKQGTSQEELSEEAQKTILYKIQSHSEKSYELYEQFLRYGLSREISRIILPFNLYTSLYWQIDLRNMFNVLKQRLDIHAQYESREYAAVLGRITEIIFPVSFSAFKEYVLNTKNS